jgi:hypothetical protein
MSFWGSPPFSPDFCIVFLQIVVEDDVTNPGKELLHSFILLLLHAGEIGDKNTVVSLDWKFWRKAVRTAWKSSVLILTNDNMRYQERASRRAL